MNAVMEGWIRAGNLDRATSLIDDLQALKDANVLREGPNYQTYNSLLKEWEESENPAKLDKIRELKDRLAALNFWIL